ncbi:MAG: hypothetical protein HYV77_02765 [Candidatus Wildermuthbacteria bacterium]|nr:hypothetical protein [Candidatus Wildermuthbacteria bacterium]
MFLVDPSAKTNWKYVGIVVIVAIAAGSWIIWYASDTMEEIKSLGL